MLFKLLTLKRDDDCAVHGAPSRAANRTLLVMVLLALALIIWRVLVLGPSSQGARPEVLERPFPVMLGYELWDLLFDRHGIIAELWDVFPYFLVGILLAGAIRTYKIAVKLQAKLRRYGALSILLATFVGLITPLCACGTLTTAISLLFAGLPLAPVVALLVTSPLMSPSTYLLTLNDLGPEWTVIRTAAAFLLGILAGTVTHLLRDRGFRTEEIFIEGAVPRGDFHDEEYPDARLRCNCKERFGHRVAARTRNTFLIFLAKSSEMLWLVGKYVLVGVSIGAVVERYFPASWTYRLFGHEDPLNIIWITVGTIPVFLHQISASSILYHIKSSLPGTLDGGAALAFLIGGPVTAMPTMVLFWAVFKKRVFGLYLGLCVIGTILIAYAFQVFLFVPGVDTGNPLFRGVTALSGGPSAVIERKGGTARMALEPDGRALIAVSSDDISGRGNIIFDAGPGRVEQEEKQDNGRYLMNAAQWLEQSNVSLAEKSILVYDMARRPAAVPSALPVGHGFDTMVTDRSATPTLTRELLEKRSQLWIVFRDGPAALAPDELRAVQAFLDAGKGLMIVAGVGSHAGANALATLHGVQFTGSLDRGGSIQVARAADLLTRTSRSLGRIL